MSRAPKGSHSLTLAQRVNARTVQGPGCWSWIGSTDPKGYGSVMVQGKAYKAHRAAYLVHVGEIGIGQVVRHACDNPGCVNPGHLLLGTTYDNNRDRVDRGRSAVGESHPRAVLSDNMVRAIREASAAGVSTRTLQVLTGLEYETVRGVVVRRTWKHV